MTGRYKCQKCPESFKKQYDLDAHLDKHTPFWNKENVTLSGADQIRIMLKSWMGDWSKFIKDEKKRVKQKGDYDLKKAIKIRNFETRNKIKFIVNNDKVESYLILNDTPPRREARV